MGVDPIEAAQAVFIVIGMFAVLATQTPNQSKIKIVQWVLTFINVLAQNWGESRNEKPKSS